MFKKLSFIVLIFSIFLPFHLVVAAEIFNPDNIEISADLKQDSARGGWHVFAITKGDLNQDGMDDYVLIVQNDTTQKHEVPRFDILQDPPYIDPNSVSSWTSLRAKRKMMVYFTQADGALYHIFSHDEWIDRGDFGGIIDEPFVGLSIDRGSIVLANQGGSRIHSTRHMRIRYQQNKWRMIGLTTEIIDMVDNNGAKYDRNLLTQKIKIDIIRNEKVVDTIWDILPPNMVIYLKPLKD